MSPLNGVALKPFDAEDSAEMSCDQATAGYYDDADRADNFSDAERTYDQDYDPLPALKKVQCPVLALDGSKDLQVSATENLPLIREALKAAGNSDVTATEMPGLNHLFQHAESGTPAEYGAIEETISPEVLQTITDWIAKRSGAR